MRICCFRMAEITVLGVECCGASVLISEFVFFKQQISDLCLVHNTRAELLSDLVHYGLDLILKANSTFASLSSSGVGSSLLGPRFLW